MTTHEDVLIVLAFLFSVTVLGFGSMVYMFIKESRDMRRIQMLLAGLIVQESDRLQKLFRSEGLL